MKYILTICATFFALVVADRFDYSPWDIFEIIVDFILKVISYPILILWCPVRCLFVPVPLEKWEREVKTMSQTKIYHLFKSVYFLHDTRAKLFFHKFFLVRIENA